jgi:hypothetical protein
VNLLQEEKEFVDKEIKNAKQYNSYLKSKLRELEESTKYNNLNNNNTDIINNNKQIKNETSFNNTSHIMKTSFSPIKNKEIEKLENYFSRNEEIYLQKINNDERLIKEKYEKYKVLEAFNNPILQILYSKVKDYEFSLMNSKISNQEVFFNVPESDLNNSKTTRKVNYFKYNFKYSKEH